MAIKLGGLAAVSPSADKINTGVWKHLEKDDDLDDNAEPKKVYLNGDKSLPMRARIRSYRCKLMADAEQTASNAGMTKMRVAKKKDRNKAFIETMLTPRQRFGLLLAALENVSDEARGVQEVTPEDAYGIFDDPEYGWVVDFVQAVAYDDGEYEKDAPVGNAGAGAAAQKPASPPPANADLSQSE